MAKKKIKIMMYHNEIELHLTSLRTFFDIVSKIRNDLNDGFAEIYLQIQVTSEEQKSDRDAAK